MTDTSKMDKFISLIKDREMYDNQVFPDKESLIKASDIPPREAFTEFPEGSFPQKLIELIKEYSIEGCSDTPAHILGEYLLQCLEAFNMCTRARDEYHGFYDAGKGEK